jgi:triosephosphate isomerase
MRKPLLAANWKMNKTIDEMLAFASEFSGQNLSQGEKGSSWPEVVICPPFVTIPGLSAALSNFSASVGAQNLHWETNGAFTGEVSAPMLVNAGCDYVIIGHSERRQLFGETDDTVKKKMRAALDAGLKPIVCVGETLEEREQGKAFDVVETMTKEAMESVKPEEVAKIVVAYEPVWAIGTGKEAKPEDAEEVINKIRETLDGMFGQGASEPVRVLYGGSVKSANVRGFMEKDTIDGALVGGASLDPVEFGKILAEVEKTRPEGAK